MGRRGRGAEIDAGSCHGASSGELPNLWTIKVEVPRIRPQLSTPHGIVPILKVYKRVYKESEIDENREPTVRTKSCNPTMGNSHD